MIAGNIANAHFPLHKERGGRSAEAGARSPVDSEASLPGLVAVTRTSDVERDLKVGRDKGSAILRLTRPAFNNVKPKDWYFVFD